MPIWNINSQGDRHGRQETVHKERRMQMKRRGWPSMVGGWPGPIYPTTVLDTTVHIALFGTYGGIGGLGVDGAAGGAGAAATEGPEAEAGAESSCAM